MKRRQESRDRSSPKQTISAEMLKKLQEKARKYDALSEKHAELNLEHEALKEKLEEFQQTQPKEDKIKELEQQVEKYKTSYLRARADFENFRKRVERDNMNFKKYALQDILKKLIGHLDDLQRAQDIIEALEDNESVKKGFKMVKQNFEKLLKEEGVKSMDSEGEKFDPYKHDAMMIEYNDDLPEDTILEVLERGYFLNEEVLRPAKVKVSKQSK